MKSNIVFCIESKAIRISLIYIIISTVWILLSDKIVFLLTTNSSHMTSLQIFKGWFFVFVTGIVIFLLINSELKSRNKIENKLRASEERYKILSNLTFEGILLHKNGFVKDLNDSMAKMIGYQKEELLGGNILKVISNGNEQLVFEKMTQENVKPYELEIIKKDGTKIPVEIEAKQVGLKGYDVRVVAVRNITERKKIYSELYENERLLKSILNHQFQLTGLINREGVLLKANKTAQKFVNRTELDLIGKKFWETPFFIQSEAEVKRLKQAFAECVEGNFLRFEMYHLDSDNNKRIVDFSLTPFFDENNEVKYVIPEGRDITDIKTSESELIKAKEKAEKADRLKSEFLAQVSHEIRTPINTILSFSNLLRSEINGNLPEDIAGSFDIMDNAGKRITRTIDLILNMSEIQTGTYELKPKSFDLLNLIQDELVNEFLHLAEDKGLEFRVSSFPDHYNILADEYTVSQIFANLIDNAIKYTHKGEIVLKLMRDNHGRVVAEITDTGIGISEEYLPALFNPFSQEEQGYTRKYEGNGLGLALVKKYCDFNNAEIQCISLKDVGTTFKIVFSNLPK